MALAPLLTLPVFIVLTKIDAIPVRLSSEPEILQLLDFVPNDPDADAGILYSAVAQATEVFEQPAQGSEPA